MQVRNGERETTRTSKRFCPFVEDPFEDCYILHTGSMYIENIVTFCGGNFKDCTVFKKNTRGKHLSKWNVLI
jgi:hypothetical protein